MDPSFEDMKKAVVIDKRRPVLPNQWSQSEVSSMLLIFTANSSEQLFFLFFVASTASYSLFRLTTQYSTVHGFDAMFGSLDTAPGYREHATPSTQKTRASLACLDWYDRDWRGHVTSRGMNFLIRLILLVHIDF